MEYYLQSLKQHQTGSHRGMEWIWEYFLGVKSIVYFTDWHIPVNYFLLAILGFAILISVVYRIFRKQWVKRTDVFLLIAILFTYMFIKAPWGYGPGGWINDRIHIYILLILAPWLITDFRKPSEILPNTNLHPYRPKLVPWLVPDIHKILCFGITTWLVIFTLIHFGRTAYDHGRISPEMAELVSGAKLIEPHTTFNHRLEVGINLNSSLDTTIKLRKKWKCGMKSNMLRHLFIPLPFMAYMLMMLSTWQTQ